MPSRGSYAKGTARREQILQTALATIAAKGFHHTSLRGIARELGLEPAHILYYFGNREDLLREVVQRWDDGSVEAAAPDADAIEVFIAALRRNLGIAGVVQLYLSFATEAIDADHPAHDFFRDRFVRSARELAEAVRTGKQLGMVRPDVDAGLTARTLIALSDGLQLQSLIDPTVDAPRDLEAFIDSLFVTGHRAHVPHRADFTALPAAPG